MWLEVLLHYSAVKSFISGMQLGSGKAWGEPPLPFYENQIKCPDVAHPNAKFSVQNIVLRLSWKKNIEEMFIKVP